MTTDNPHQPAYTPKTDDEIRKLAQDYQDGKIFTDRNIYHRDRESMLHLVFKPIVFLSDAARQQFVDLEVVLLYQYKDEATLFATNGYPSFMSMRFMTRPEADSFLYYVEELSKLKEEVAQRLAAIPQPS